MSRTYRKGHARKAQKASKRRRPPREDRHHIRPKAVGGDNSPENLIVIDRRLHNVIHDVFRTLPPEQYLPYARRNPGTCVYKLVRSAVRNFGAALVLNALRDLDVTPQEVSL